jgi:hypothetical protein
MHPLRLCIFAAQTTLLLLLLASSPRTHALDAGEIDALKDMQQEWGEQMGWTGVPSCNYWRGINCDRNGHVLQMYGVPPFFFFFLLNLRRPPQSMGCTLGEDA